MIEDDGVLSNDLPQSVIERDQHNAASIALALTGLIARPTFGEIVSYCVLHNVNFCLILVGWSYELSYFCKCFCQCRNTVWSSKKTMPSVITFWFWINKIISITFHLKFCQLSEIIFNTRGLLPSISWWSDIVVASWLSFWSCKGRIGSINGHESFTSDM